MLLTNETYWMEGDKQVARKFKLIATYEEMSWVKAMNGAYEGELLTFKSSDLRPLREGE